MKKAVYAILFHFTDFSDSYTRHQFCPRGKYSWCKYWALNQKNYKPKSTIPLWIKELILPIIINLQSDELLSKCLHGNTQNANEALNGLIWARVPKRVFVSKSTLEMGTYSAILAYNDGAKGFISVFRHFGLHGKVSNISATSKNKKRISQMRCKLSEKGKKRRKTLRAIKKGHLDEEKAKECNGSYVSGGFYINIVNNISRIFQSFCLSQFAFFRFCLNFKTQFLELALFI